MSNTNVKFKINRGALAAVLKNSETTASVNELADRLAAAVRSLVGEDLPVDVRPYTTDRASVGVAIAHPAGKAMQAKHGTMTRAAASLGTTVSSR